MNEKNIFILLISLFIALYFMPADSAIFQEAVLSGFSMLHEYATQHVLTCLVPAFFIAGGISILVKKEAVLKYLGGNSKKYLSYPIASVSGSVLAVCSCTILPLFAGIKTRGAGLGPATTFLFSGPAINIAAVFLTFSVLGAEIGIARVLSAILLSILVGLSMHVIFRERIDKGEMYFQSQRDVDMRGITVFIFFVSMVSVLVISGLQLAEMVKYGLITLFIGVTALIAYTQFAKEVTIDWLRETWFFTKILIPYLFIGVFIAGFIMPLLPREIIEAYVGNNSVTGNLIASIFGAFMYFSTLTEIPILQAFMAKGMAKGPALALLLAGPSLSLPNMLVIRKVLGNRKTAVYVTLVVLYSTSAGLIFGSM